MGDAQIAFEKYSPVGDFVIVAVCFVILILVYTSYVNKTRAFLDFNIIITLLSTAAICDVLYHYVFTDTSEKTKAMVYFLRCMYHTLLFALFLMYVVYITELLRLESEKKHRYTLVAIGIFTVVVGVDVIGVIRGTGFKINDDGTITSGRNFFAVGYVAFTVLILFIMIAYRGRLYKQVMRGFFATMAISFAVLVLQGIHGQRSFTTVTFLFPVISMFYIVHSNPYDLEIGAVNVSAFEDMIRYNNEKGRPLIFMSLYLREFEEERKPFPKEIQGVIRRFAGTFFKGAVLFQISNGHMVLLADKAHNPDYVDIHKRIMEAFEEEYKKYRFDYKIVFGLTDEEVSRHNEYVNFIKFIHRNMSLNSSHSVSGEDIEHFYKNEYILKELLDICRGGNLRDPRVLAYCQPVFNVKTGKYDTAEALMRLKLQDTGMVFPDQFIQLAEENGLIHGLTKIILQKTCDEIRYLIGEGYEVNRISVNISVQELHDDSFCDDIMNIIEGSGIPDEKIAIEITESQNESDFEAMKNKINILKEKGIKFYLDDFGTGYSNMERIMELPFDIIKFDRSLVIASDSNVRSEQMVGGLANMFSEMQYSVLYEGIENDVDERRCVDMSASYLQGYKYSKPIPIMDLKKFFSKADSEKIS
ncbi:EAL domain, c-di-GMP-specific phosphodiesterase class I (or its enzymatically inactive variant) [Eubacterium ruminantium]|nr:EAL domain, c-di-GMP-specific phosphodiesterase class I (or its enzymatically inactive variant) [Eubacterium ruminantium]